MLVERAKRYKYSEHMVNILANDTRPLNAITTLFNMFYPFREQCLSKTWCNMFAAINDYDLWHLMGLYQHLYGKISTDMCRNFVTEDACLSYFSVDGFLCESINDAEIIMRCWDCDYKAQLASLCRDIYRHIDALLDPDQGRHVCRLTVFDVIDTVKKSFDPKMIMDSLDVQMFNEMLSENQNYLREQVDDCLKVRSFDMSDADDIPDDIKSIDFKGYNVIISVSGLTRKVSYKNDMVWIEAIPYQNVIVNEHGIYPKRFRDKTRKIAFNVRTEEFIYGYNTSRGYKFVPARLRDLFEIISIGNTEQGKIDARGVVEFLCRRYGTYLFRDLYADYLASGGLMLPILITEAAQYKTKKDMFRLHYKSEMACNWNSKNANLSYMLIKLQPRMTDAAIARAIQCKAAPKCEHIGKYRSKMVYSMYSALYGTVMDIDLHDALYEEYDDRAIRLDPVRTTVNRHNARHMNENYRKRSSRFRIKKDTRFKPLIDNMPEEYELIKTPKRLSEEATQQHNCVAGYADYINSDVCMIYSTVYNDARYTFEIRASHNRYRLVQLKGVCNKSAPKELRDNIQTVLSGINQRSV